MRDELGGYRARLREVSGDAFVFGTSTGKRQGASNVRRRVLAKAVELANEQLTAAELEALPVGLTPHSLRRTFISLLLEIGENPRYVMSQAGHTTPHLTLAIYAQVMDRRDGESERLQALVNGEEWAPMGTNEPENAIGRRPRSDAKRRKPRVLQGFRTMGAAGFEPATSRV